MGNFVSPYQIIGVPDRRMGEEVCACIKLKAGETATAEEIKEFCTGEVSIVTGTCLLTTH